MAAGGAPGWVDGWTRGQVVGWTLDKSTAKSIDGQKTAGRTSLTDC
jgi:hypothetical protein